MTAALVAIAPLIVGGLVTIVLLRVQAGRRTRRLQRLCEAEGLEWAALCRVLADGDFLDSWRSRRGGGPRGTLRSSGGWLEYEPDALERRRGDSSRRWAWADVSVRECRTRRDISGIRYSWCRIAFPEGQAVIAIFGATGPTPTALQTR